MLRTQWSDHLTDRVARTKQRYTPGGTLRSEACRWKPSSRAGFIARSRISCDSSSITANTASAAGCRGARAGRHARRVAPDRARGADRARGRGAPARSVSAPGIYVIALSRGAVCSAPMPIEGPVRGLARARVRGKRGGRRSRPQATPEDIARLDAILAEVGGPALSVERLGCAGPALPPRRGRDARQRRAAALRSASCSTSASIPISCSSRGTSRTTPPGAPRTWSTSPSAMPSPRRSGRCQSRHARASGALAPALLARFRRGAVRSRGQGASLVHSGGPAARQGRRSVQDTQRPHKAAAC